MQRVIPAPLLVEKLAVLERRDGERRSGGKLAEQGLRRGELVFVAREFAAEAVRVRSAAAAVALRAGAHRCG